eukprot:1703399-Rhodomonas_salina.1
MNTSDRLDGTPALSYGVSLAESSELPEGGTPSPGESMSRHWGVALVEVRRRLFEDQGDSSCSPWSS